MKKALNVLKLWTLTALAAATLTGTASAQSLLKGSFTLPYEVHWGKAVLAPGSYVITMDRAYGPAIVRTAAGTGQAFVMARTTSSAREGYSTALLISQSENQRFVRSFNWREGNTEFVYLPFSKAERQRQAKADETVVPILMAQK